MASFRVAAELRLVDCGKGEVLRENPLVGAVVPAADYRHAFGGAQDIARTLGDDPLLAGDQGDMAFALHPADPVIDLTRQQPQRKADHAAGMAAHAFDGEVGLAGVGGAENGPDKRVTGHELNVAVAIRARKRQRRHFRRNDPLNAS